MPNVPDSYPVPATGVCLTASAAAAGLFSIQNIGSQVELLPAATTTIPTNWDGALRIDHADGFINVTISELWPGCTHTHLHARALHGSTVSFASA